MGDRSHSRLHPWWLRGEPLPTFALAALFVLFASTLASATPFALIGNSVDDTISVIDNAPGLHPGFELLPAGSVTTAAGEVIVGTHSIKGAYFGSDSFTPYLRTDPTAIVLEAGKTYRVTFVYRILTTPDQGFEVLFYSPTGGALGNFLPPFRVTGSAGDTGSGTLTNTLDVFSDYRVQWNVIGTGAIAIDNIQLVDVATGSVIASEGADVAVTETIALSGTPSGIAVNPLRREAYAAVLSGGATSALAVIKTNVFEQVAEIFLSVVDPTDIAVSPAGTRAYVTGGFTDNLVSVVDLDTRKEITTIATGSVDSTPGPVGIVVHPTLPRLYVANSNAGTISVINTATNTVVATITLAPCPIGCGPTELALSPTGGFLYVSDPFADAVWVINTASNTIVRSVDLGVLALPEGIAAHPDGARVFVANLDATGAGRLTTITNPATSPVLTHAPVGSNPLGVAIDPSGTNVYVVSHGDDAVTVADAGTPTSQTVVAVGGAPTTFGRFVTAALAPAAPTITGFTPTSGPVGTLVTITGTNLEGTSVTFTGPVTVTPTAVMPTSLKLTAPPGALTGPLSVTNEIGTATSLAAFKVLPSITGFTPTSAAAGSSTVVFVSGNNLRAASGEPVVKIGTFTVASVNGSTLTELQFTVPLGAVTGKISVTTADGTATSATDLTVIQPPKVTTFTPAAAPVNGLVTIGGTNLTGATAVTFTGPVTVTPTAVTATSLKATVPAGALTGPVSVTNPAGTGTSSTAFKVQPRITEFAPSSAVAGSGTVIVVSGNNLRAGTGTPVVKIGTFTVTSVNGSMLTELQFTVPLGPVTGKISVTTIDGTATSATDLTVIQPPKVTTLTPAMGPVGALITIGGTNLAGATDVTFTGPVTVTPTAVTATSLKVTVPVGALTGPVSVTNPIGTGASTVPFKVQPRIVSFAPSSAVAGSATVIVVSGNNLRAASGEPVVKIGTFTVASVNGSTLTELQFTVPLGAVTGKISVTTADGTATSATDLTVIQPPKVTTFTPAAAPVNGLVTIGGTNLAEATAVTFTGPVTVTPTAVTATSLKATVPVGALTGPVSVTNPVGTGTSTVPFKVQPRIVSFAPSSAVAGSGTVIVVSGNNLRAATGTPVVKIGTFTVTSVNASTLTELQFTVPLGAVTGKISVTTIDGTATSATDLTVIQPPKVTTLTPAMGPVGALITIGGTSLTGATDVTFTGPVTVTPTAVTATSLKVTVPVGALTGPVSVTNPIGTGTSTVPFKVQPRIVSFAPSSAVAGSSTVIVVSGNNLRAATGTPVVKIGTFTLTSVNASTLTELQFRVPLGAVTGKLSVTTIDGTATSATDLTVIQPPKVTTLTPAMGPVGALITIAGTSLTGATDVTFTGPVTVTPTAVTATSLKVTVPVGALTGPVSVTNPIGTGTSTLPFKVQPRIVSFAPSSAVAGSATVIVVSGNNLRAATGTPVVKIGTFTVTSVNASTLTELQFTVPLGAVTGKISVTTADGTGTSATDLTVIQPPKVTTLTPAMGPVGALITIGGTNLAGATAVTFTGPVTVTPTAVTATSLKAVVPPDALTGPVSVTNPIGTGTSTAAFKVQPRITHFGLVPPFLGPPPPAGVVGDSVVAVGFNLRASTGEPVVKIGTLVVPAGSVTSSTLTEILFTIPPTAVTGKISVTTVDGTATTVDALRVIKPPTITGFTPASGPVGTIVTITGTNLLDFTDVAFNGVSAGFPIAVSATSLQMAVPAGAASGKITVTNRAGSAQSAGTFTVTGPAATLPTRQGRAVATTGAMEGRR